MIFLGMALVSAFGSWVLIPLAVLALLAGVAWFV